MKNKSKERIGEEVINNFGSKMVIIDARDSNHMDIFFPSYNYVTKDKKYTNFKNGKIKCPYEKRYYNIGYIGEGKYDGNECKRVRAWMSMLQRCYDPYFLNKHPTYRDCIVCEEWHNFQNFAKWYDENYYEIGEEIMSLDKDILVKGNKIYSPETCVFVSQRINTLIIKSDDIKTTYHKDGRNKIYSVTIRIEGKRFSKGFFTLKEAKLFYKQFKENYIKRVADEYKNLIPKKLYEAMYEYKIEIND